MHVVYEPKGRAREYSPLACNLYMGCPHGCKYCFAPGCMRKTADEWHSNTIPRNDVVALLEKDAEKLRGDTRKILFSFLSDPYQPLEKALHLTRQALEICCANRLRNQILTKGSAELIMSDFGLMKKAKTELGLTISFSEDASRQKWEPRAASIEDRLLVLKEAHAANIYTWVSLEPVIDPAQALEVIRKAAPYVRFWKIGKLNHMKEFESEVDWKKFANEAQNILCSLNAKYYFKEGLSELLENPQHCFV